MFQRGEPVASPAGKEPEKWSDIRQLGWKAEQWYRDNLVGKSVVKAKSGGEVLFIRDGARKVGGRKGDILYRVVPALERIIEQGQFSDPVSDVKGNKDVKAWYTVAARVELDGQLKDVIATVKETADGLLHYDLSRDTGDGAKLKRTSISPDSQAYGLEDNPVSLNIELAAPEFKRHADPAKLQALMPVLQNASII